MLVKAIPEPGQLVKVRSRQYVVTEVRQTAIPSNPMLAGLEPPQNLVMLSSVEDDALGEELQVIWELEAGPYVHERPDLRNW